MLNRLSPTSTLGVTEGEQGFDLREMIGFAWRQWKFIASVATVTLVIGTVTLLKETPLYTASALVLLDPPREKATGTEAIFSDMNLLDDAIIESQLSVISSTVFLRRVVEKEHLVSEPEFRPGPSGTASASALPAPVGASGPPEVIAAVEALRGATSAKRLGQGYTLSISVTSVDPARSAKLANAVADAYVVEKLDARFEAAKRASAWLSDRLVELRQQLRESEEAVAKFRADNGLVQSGANVSLSQQQLSELNAKLVETRADVAQKKARVDLLRSIVEKGGDIQSLPDVPASPALQALRQQELAISQKEADLVTRFTARHPLVVNIQAEHRDIQRSIASEMQRLGENVNNEYELAKSRVDTVERSFREATGQTGVDDRTAITLRELERTAAVNKSFFEDFLQRAKITEEQSTFEARDSRVISPALPPRDPSYPRKVQFMGLTLFIGLFLGIGGAVAKDKLNGGFATPRQIEDMLQVPLLTSANIMEAKDLTVKGKVIRIPMYPIFMPLSRFSEAIRTLRSGIQMTDVDHPPKVIQVTSTVPNEGKTIIALSLATSAANSGLKVLFIDADLRHTSGSNFFGLVKAQGLVDVLLGSCLSQDAITFSEEAKIWVLPAGSKTRNPADILGSNRMKSLLDQCNQTFDMIVIDSPPVGPVIDPIILAQFVDSVVYIVRWASTSRELVQQSMRRLPGHKIAGVVFNMVNEKAAQKYGRYAYQYYYGTRSYKKYYEG